MKRNLILSVACALFFLPMKAQQCEVNFDLNYDTTQKIEGISVKQGCAIPMDKKPLPQREGYRFGGWYTSQEGQAQDEWRSQLSVVQAEGASEEMRRVFYSCLYFSLFYPQIYSDVDGQYRSSDAQVYRDPRHPYYAGVLGLWDTYRNHAPLIAVLRPDVTRHLMHTFLSHYRHSGILPMWTIAGQENNCMTGYHAMPVIADAMARGLVDDSIACPLLRAMVASANRDCFGYFDLDFRGARHYRRFGYVPSDYEAHSASAAYSMTSSSLRVL